VRCWGIGLLLGEQGDNAIIVDWLAIVGNFAGFKGAGISADSAKDRDRRNLASSDLRSSDCTRDRRPEWGRGKDV
jgi:hypothetical protein